MYFPSKQFSAMFATDDAGGLIYCLVPEIRPKFVMYSLYLCNNSDRTCLFRALTFAGTGGRGFQHLPRDPANVNARNNMFDPCIDLRGTSDTDRN